MSGFVPKANWNDQLPARDEEVLTTHIQTDAVSQFGCGYCLSENVTAPSNPVYLWGGTSMCGKHFKIHILQQQPETSPEPKDIPEGTNLVP